MKLKILALAIGIMASAACASAQTEINRLIYATDWGKGETNSAFADFESWANQFTATSNITSKAQILSNGVSLAKERRRAFAELIKSDPEKALALTVPASIRQQLPAEVNNELETRVSGIGDYSVIAALPVKDGPPVEPIQRSVHLNGQTYRAYVYGRRLGETCKDGIPLHGVVLDSAMALHESALRELETDETQDVSKQVVDLRTTIQRSVGISTPKAAEMGGTIYRFVSPAQMQQTEARLESAEAGIGVQPLQSTTNIMNESGQSGTGVRPLDLPTPWTTGIKKVLFIRIDFSDLPGDPVDGAGNVNTVPYIQNIADTQVSPFYLKSSYGLTSLTNTVTTQVYRMPNTAAFYATNSAGGVGPLHADAETAASTNYTLANYDRIIVVFSSLGNIPGSVFNFAGLSDVGGSRVWINGGCNGFLLDHELGHTYGVFHGNLWQVSDGNPISTSGSSIEYGDSYNIMGYAYYYPLCDFNPWFKNKFGWISDTQVQTVTTNGIYRIYAFDYDNYAAAPGEMLALKIAKDAARNYWIGCRCNFTNNTSMENGAYIIWGYNYNRQGDLLDMTTPGTNIQDAALSIGAIFTDTATNITFRPVAQGGVAPNKYLDVQVIFGAVPPLPPIITMQITNSTITLGDNATFAIAASGNPSPSYQWQLLASGSTSWISLNDNNGNYSNSGSASLTVNQPSMAMNGEQFRCIVSNSSGSITSSPPAVLTVNSPLVISTLAGLAGNHGSANGTGTNASFYSPYGIAADKVGNNIYVADWYFGLVRTITPYGVVSTFASGFVGPEGIAVDRAGNIYVADTYHQTIRKITPTGAISTLTGLSGTSGSVDGTNTNARFNYPGGIAVDGLTNIYVADTGNNTVRKITPNATGTQWVVSTIAGTTNSGSLDGIGTNAQFNYLHGIAVDSATNIYVADSNNRRIRKISLDSTGTNWTVTTIAGGNYGSADGIGTNAQFSGPWGIAMDNGGNLYVADAYNQTIRKITPDKTGTNWVVTTVAGLAYTSGSADGAGTNAQFNGPYGIAVDNATNIYITDQNNNTVRVGRFASVVIPTLQITRASNQAILSWPIPTATFTFESTTNLLMTNWIPVTPTPLVINGQNFVTNSIFGGARFYRLRQ